MQNWSDKWLLSFHPGKNGVINLTISRETRERKYQMEKLTGDELILHYTDSIKEEKMMINVLQRIFCTT